LRVARCFRFARDAISALFAIAAHTEHTYSYAMNATTATNDGCLADEIALLAAQVDVGMHRLLSCIRRFDESEEWAHQGARTCADWLAWRIGLTPGAAREKVRVARALGRFAAIEEAMSAGRLSYAKVRALTRVATAANEARLVEIALATTGAQLERVCRRFRRAVHEGALSDVQRDWDPSGGERGVRVRTPEAGLVRIEATLDPAEAALVLAAIEKARDELRAATGAVTAGTGRVSAETPERVAEAATPGRADGLIAIAERTLAPAPAPAPQAQAGATSGGHHVHQVVIHLDQAVLGPDGSGRAIAAAGSRYARTAASSTRTTCTTGPTAAAPASTTSSCCADSTTASSTKADSGCRWMQPTPRRGFSRRPAPRLRPFPMPRRCRGPGRHRPTIPTSTCAAGTASPSTTTRRSTRSSPPDDARRC